MYLFIKSYDVMSQLVVEIWKESSTDGDRTLLCRSYSDIDVATDHSIVAQVEQTGEALFEEASVLQEELDSVRHD